ncbi:sigma-70 family RNA polymerase sigma factor [Prolixibacteraceae bacterium JC049]|jgi:RNA polymerase sigma-70 factor (ECF subfamily)|nr:sigma-70 family RNA polymerase sigma factor [Prolixibacteraceae bacterium JC049]
MESNKSQLSEKASQDYSLVLAALDGDEKAFAYLMAKYKDALFYMLLKMVNSKSDAEDLTIEAFGKAFNNLHQYTPTYAFSTWLFKIASNNCIDFLRKQKGVTVPIDGGNIEGVDPKENPMGLKSQAPNPEEKLIRKQKAILLRTVVRKLKPRFRDLVELRYFKELSYDEIAKELDLPLGTVKAQLFRAREKLFELVEMSEIKEK